jgi:hypothetical protein
MAPEGTVFLYADSKVRRRVRQGCWALLSEPRCVLAEESLNSLRAVFETS